MRDLRQQWKKWLQCGVIVMCMFNCTACVDVATASAQAIYNRKSLQKNFQDQYLTLQVYQALQKSQDFHNASISISTYNQEMILIGQVPAAWQKAKAEAIARSIPGIKTIYNLLQISNPASSLTKMSDAWITTKVKTKLIASEDLDATKIKVVTENGVVYLMGILPPEEAETAVDLASHTKGVLRVVKIFSYIHISKS